MVAIEPNPLATWSRKAKKMHAQDKNLDVDGAPFKFGGGDDDTGVVA